MRLFLCLTVVFLLSCVTHSVQNEDFDIINDTGTDNGSDGNPDSDFVSVITPPVLPALPLAPAMADAPVIPDLPCLNGSGPNPQDFNEVIHVAAGESIQSAVDNACDNALILISPGTFNEVVTIDKNISICGTCDGWAEIKPTSAQLSETEAAFAINSGTVNICSLKISGSMAGMAVKNSATAKLEDLLIENATAYGIYSDGKITASDIYITGTKPYSDGMLGKGIALSNGAVLDISNSLLFSNHHAGITVSGKNTTLKTDNITVKNTLPIEADSNMGYGIAVYDGASAILSKTLIDGNRTFGLSVIGDADKTTVEAESLVITNTQSEESDSLLGWGIYIEKNAFVSLSKALISGNATVGVLISGFEDKTGKTILSATDITIDNTLEQGKDSTGGEGLVILNNASVTLKKGLFEKNRHFGILVSVYEQGNYTASLNGEDITVKNTLPQISDGSAGIGIAAFLNSDIILNRAFLEENSTAGILIYGDESGVLPALFKAYDITVNSTLSQQTDGEYGVGIAIQEAAQVDIERAALTGNREIGIMVIDGNLFDSEPVLNLRQAVISKTLPRKCYETADCAYLPGLPFGYGIAVYDNSIVNLSGVELRKNSTGLQAAVSEVYSVKPCEKPCLAFISNETAVSAFNLPEGYDINESLGECLYSDNKTIFSGDTQSVPNPIKAGN